MYYEYSRAFIETSDGRFSCEVLRTQLRQISGIWQGFPAPVTLVIDREIKTYYQKHENEAFADGTYDVDHYKEPSRILRDLIEESLEEIGGERWEELSEALKEGRLKTWRGVADVRFGEGYFEGIPKN